MYVVDKYSLGSSNEYEIKYKGNFGANGEKRAKRHKATPEQIARQNQHNRQKKVRRTIKLNFEPGDLWVTLKLLKGVRISIQEFRAMFKKFLDGMRYEYKKRGQPFKFIYRVEVGRKGGIHVHILVNRLRGTTDTDTIIQKRWPHGHVYFTSIYEQGGYEELAEYITKQPDEEVNKQLSLFPEEERKELIAYQCSRNLIKPEPVRKLYKRKTLRDLIENGPKPTQGYYIEKSSIISGVNPYTGMSYYQYTECKIDRTDIDNLFERRQE